MFVALVIWVLAKLVDALPEESFSLKRFISNIHQNIILGKEERKQLLKQFRETQVKGSVDLNNYHHGHA